MLSITAASVGLTLTAASTVVFAELTWTPSVMNQAEDRAHRIGQKNSVNIYYMHGTGTLDDLMMNALQEKSLVTSDIMEGVKESLNIQQADANELPLDEIQKDGTTSAGLESVPRIKAWFKAKKEFTKLDDSIKEESSDSGADISEELSKSD